MIYVSGQYSWTFRKSWMPEHRMSRYYSNVTKSQLYHIWSGIPGPTRQFPLAISLSIKLELLGLLELTSLENGFLLSKRKESTPYSHYNEERNKLITLPRSLPLEETTLRTPRNWTTPSQRNLSFSSSLLQVTFCQVANSKSHKGLSHIMKVRRCQYMFSPVSTPCTTIPMSSSTNALPLESLDIDILPVFIISFSFHLLQWN